MPCAVGGSWPWCVVMLHAHGFRTMQAMATGQGKAKGQGNGPWRLLMRHGPLSSAVAMGHGLGCWHRRMSRPWVMSWHVAKGPGHGHGRGPKGHVDGRLWSRVVAISCVRDHGQSYGHGQGYSQRRMAHGRKHDVRFDRGSVELRIVLDERLAEFRHSFDNASIKI